MTKLDKQPRLGGERRYDDTPYTIDSEETKRRRGLLGRIGAAAAGLAIIIGAGNVLINQEAEATSDPDRTVSETYNETTTEQSPEEALPPEITEGFYLYNPPEVEISFQSIPETASDEERDQIHQANIDRIRMSTAEIETSADIPQLITDGISEWVVTGGTAEICKEWLESGMGIHDFAEQKAREHRMYYQEAWFGSTMNPDDPAYLSNNEGTLATIEEWNKDFLVQALPNIINSEHDSAYTMHFELVESANDAGHTYYYGIENGAMTLQTVITGEANENNPEPGVSDGARFTLAFDAWAATGEKLDAPANNLDGDNSVRVDNTQIVAAIA